MSEMLTYAGWQKAGRQICAGEKAEFYLVDPTGTHAHPLFREEQTKPMESKDGIWTTIVPADERPRRGKPYDKRPKLKMEYDDGVLSVWCGPDKKAISGMKKSGFRFDKYSHRWRAERTLKQAFAAVAAYEEAGYLVDHDLEPEI